MNLQISDSEYGSEKYKPLRIVTLIAKFPHLVAVAILVLFLVIAGGTFLLPHSLKNESFY